MIYFAIRNIDITIGFTGKTLKNKIYNLQIFLQK